MKNWIKVERAKKNMSQEALAKALKVSRYSINGIEADKYMPSAEIALRIARYFNVKAEEIFFLEPEEYYLERT